MTPSASLIPALATEPADDSEFETLEDTIWKQFFYAGRGGYAMQRKDGTFIPLPAEGQVRQHLKILGADPKIHADLLCKIREKNYVSFIGPVAGLKQGIHIAPDSGSQILVTVPPKIISANHGEWPLIRRIMEGLFSDPNQPDQCLSVYGWMKQARANVVAGQRRPLPVLSLIGPRNSGKTLFLEILRVTLGGRSASAYAAFTKENGFNFEVLGAELLTIDDEVASKDGRARSRFGQAIKRNCFTSSIRIEPKGYDAFNARPVHAVAIALNDEPEHLRVLPELDDSLQDKISLIKTGRAKITDQETEDKKVFWNRIMKELPAFLGFLESLSIPRPLRDTRTGAAAFHHPEIFKSLRELSPEYRLYILILQCDGTQDALKAGKNWEGTAAELEAALTSMHSSTQRAAQQLLQWGEAAGVYLGKLADSESYPVSRLGQRDGVMRWSISPSRPVGEQGAPP
jgi:hypothetical protein